MRDLNQLNRYRLNDVERRIYGTHGGATEGVFAMPSPLDGAPLHIIASAGMGWDHVSVSRADRCPTWAERVTCELMDAITRADKLAEALALLPDEIAMVEHNPDDGPLMFCCGREVNDLGPRGLLITHDGGCWYARMRALRDHDQEGK